MLMIEPPPGLDDMRDADLGAEKRAVEIEFDDAPEFFFRRISDRAILRRGAAGIVVKDRQFSKPLHRFREGRFDVRLARGCHSG